MIFLRMWFYFDQFMIKNKCPINSMFKPVLFLTLHPKFLDNMKFLLKVVHINYYQSSFKFFHLMIKLNFDLYSRQQE